MSDFELTNKKNYCFVVLSLLMILLIAGSANALQRISFNPMLGDSNGASSNAEISMDGRYIAFESTASNLVANDNNGASDVFVYDCSTQLITRISVDISGAEVYGYSGLPSISGDGRYIAYASIANGITPDDYNNNYDVFVYDQLLNTVERISVGIGGADSNGESVYPSINYDGSYVAFRSDATNLVPVDVNACTDIFLYDRSNKTMSLVSSAPAAQADGNSSMPSISGDGLSVAFESHAANLVPNDTNNVKDVFVYNKASNTITRVSVDASGNQANADSNKPSINMDGNFVAFQSDANNLVPDDTNNSRDIFLYNISAGTIDRVSMLAGVQGDSSSVNPSINMDGSMIAFESASSNFASGDTNNTNDVFVYNNADKSLKIISELNGVIGDALSGSSAIDGTGAKVAFQSVASNLAPDDTNGLRDIYLYTYSNAADMTIKAGTDTAYIGQDIYNSDGTNQTRSQNGIRKKPVMYLFRVYNRGAYEDLFKITGPGSSSGWTVRYYKFGSTVDVTDLVTSYGWVTPYLAPGGTTGVYALVAPDGTAVGSTNTLLVEASSIYGNSSDTVKAITEYPACAKPDLLIKASTDANYIGEGIINNDGTDQTRSLDVLANRNAMYLFRVYNSGNVNDTIKIQGPGSSGGWTVNYYLFGTTTNVTNDVVNNGYNFNLDPGATSGVYALVNPNSTVPIDETYTLSITATSGNDSSKLDVVKAVTTRK